MLTIMLMPWRKIAIIGAGPAGIISGIYLTRAGHDVTIFEKNKEVISTPCGEGISHRTIEKLQQDTGFDSTPYFSKKVKGLKNVFPGNRTSYIYKQGYVLNRQAWIEGLQKYFEKCGGKIEFGKDIRDFAEFRNYDYIIGADGPNSYVRRFIGGTVDIISGSQYKIELDWENKDFVEFYWDKDVSQFYAWNFPKSEYHNVGTIGNFNHLDNFIKKYRMNGKIIKKEAYPIPFNGKKIQYKNIALIGDAAGMANPFSKGGLAPIVYASHILTTCINQDLLNKYEQYIRSHAAFSPQYQKVCNAITQMTQDKLSAIGMVVHGKELLNMPITAYLMVLKYPHIIPEVITLYRGFKKGIEYGW